MTYSRPGPDKGVRPGIALALAVTSGSDLGLFSRQSRRPSGAARGATLRAGWTSPPSARQSRVLVVAGKGGVGKTTMTAALARMAAEAGLSVLVVELEGKPGITAAFGRTGAPRLRRGRRCPGRRRPGAPGTVRARRITPDDALLEYLADHGMKRISKRLVSSGALDVVSTAIPGIRDILVLGKVKQLERERGGRSDPGRRPGHRPRHDLPLLGQRPARRGPRRARYGPRRPTWSSCCRDPTAARSPSSRCPRRCR